MKRIASLLLACAVSAGALAAPPDTPDALRLRAATGDAQAAYRLGLMVRNGALGGAINEADPARALALLSRAAEGGVPAAMFVLANMLAAGEGTPRDEAGARHWLETAAALEYPEALQQLALTEPDPRKAELLMRQAAHAMMHRARD